MNFKNFEMAFDSHRGRNTMQCKCGKKFYNSDGGWDFEDGELEALRKDPNAVDLDCSVSILEFEGSQYVMDCECWKKRAEKIMQFLDFHKHQIAQYFRLEKLRFQNEANEYPQIEENHD